MGWSVLSWYLRFCDANDDIEDLCLEIAASSEVSNALTELNSSTGVSGANEANDVDKMSRTWQEECF